MPGQGPLATARQLEAGSGCGDRPVRRGLGGEARAEQHGRRGGVVGEGRDRRRRSGEVAGGHRHDLGAGRLRGRDARGIRHLVVDHRDRRGRSAGAAGRRLRRRIDPVQAGDRRNAADGCDPGRGEAGELACAPRSSDEPAADGTSSRGTRSRPADFAAARIPAALPAGVTTAPGDAAKSARLAPRARVTASGLSSTVMDRPDRSTCTSPVVGLADDLVGAAPGSARSRRAPRRPRPRRPRRADGGASARGSNGPSGRRRRSRRSAGSGPSE